MYQIFSRMYLGFQSSFRSTKRLPITSQRFYRNKTIGNKIGVPVAQGLYVPNFFDDVPNFVKDVPNFIKDVPNFVKDLSIGPKSILKWGSTSNQFLRLSKGINGPWKGR